MCSLRATILAAGLALLPRPAPAQAWNSAAACALVQRAVARRAAAETDTAPRSYTSRAHGVVTFQAELGPVGELAAPPRLLKADELDVEVYWRAPDRSKQVIRAWRDTVFFPTEIVYHRDHLGIVTDDFGPLIRIGEGDEVRDVPHPLSPGVAGYDFAVDDTLFLRGAGDSLAVVALRVRPKAPGAP